MSNKSKDVLICFDLFNMSDTSLFDLLFRIS